MAQRTVDSHIISEITHKESHLTHQPNPIKGGPTAQAQKHAGDTLSDGHIISDIAKAEEGITHHGGPVPGGPAAFVQSEIAHARNEVSNCSKTVSLPPPFPFVYVISQIYNNLIHDFNYT